ncbi:hypothetical protein EB796_015498 [Bugula neritina]|uniref:CHCH domain-containing protein n=1 Tax=Bugula neritina TaxID=10212 RepID=A0A7J7JLF4_BUGNE|nr:hypothetical protein EB796_015498 [Bugula neritina]
MKRLTCSYMSCLRRSDLDNSACRELSKAYLKCRMENNLMTKEEWKNLGYNDDTKTAATESSEKTDSTASSKS